MLVIDMKALHMCLFRFYRNFTDRGMTRTTEDGAKRYTLRKFPFQTPFCSGFDGGLAIVLTMWRARDSGQGALKFGNGALWWLMLEDINKQDHQGPRRDEDIIEVDP